MARAAQARWWDRRSRSRGKLRSPHHKHGRITRRKRLRALGRIVAYVVLPVALVLAYVDLTACLTAQTYRLSTESIRNAHLQRTANELRNTVAQLESLDRLQAVAAKLHMSEPTGVAVVTMPAQQPQRRAWEGPIAIVARWFAAR